MKRLFSRIAGLTATIAMLCAIINVNSACSWAVYQPKIPADADKLKKWKK